MLTPNQVEIDIYDFLGSTLCTLRAEGIEIERSGMRIREDGGNQRNKVQLLIRSEAIDKGKTRVTG
jgi:hypothetical protein